MCGLDDRWNGGAGNDTRPGRARVLLTLGVLVALIAAACGSEAPPSPSTTTGTALPPRTTLAPPPTTGTVVSTTTTVPAEIATEVDACGLATEQDVRPVAGEDAGPGTPVDTSNLPGRDQATAAESTATGGDEPDAGAPSLLLSGCSWPTDGNPAVVLTYLAPSTAGSALRHLDRVITMDSRFARRSRVFPLPPDGELGPAALVDDAGNVIEIAVVTGSALLYVVPTDPPESGSREANALLSLLMAAAREAPG